MKGRRLRFGQHASFGHPRAPSTDWCRENGLGWIAPPLRRVTGASARFCSFAQFLFLSFSACPHLCSKSRALLPSETS